jgi:hypothetical protein
MSSRPNWSPSRLRPGLPTHRFLRRLDGPRRRAPRHRCLHRIVQSARAAAAMADDSVLGCFSVGLQPSPPTCRRGASELARLVAAKGSRPRLRPVQLTCSRDARGISSGRRTCPGSVDGASELRATRFPPPAAKTGSARYAPGRGRGTNARVRWRRT